MSGITPTQAVLSYDAPDAGACRVEVSELPSYSPLVVDVDPVLFPGSNLDTRAGALSAGRQRVFVIGKHGMNAASASNPFLGADGRRHSRALQAGTAHYYRVTCGASSFAGSFTTPWTPLGSTYGEMFPTDSSRPGAYNWPDFRPGDRAERSVDPVTGALIRKITVDDDLTPFSPAWTSAGAFSMCSHVPIASGGDTYYLCSIPSSYGGMLVSINTASGDVLPLTSLVVPYEAISNEATLSCGTVAFDSVVPTQLYCIQVVSGKQSLLLGEWTGPVNVARRGIKQEIPDPLLRWTNLTPAPHDLTSLLAAFDPLFTPAQQSNIPYYMIVGQQKGKIIARLLARQDAGGWIVVFDPGNKRALGAGGTAGIAAALPKLVVAGFDAIYVNRLGYADAGAELESEISATIGRQSPLVNADGTLAMYDLRSYAKNLNISGGRQPSREWVLHPISISYGIGFYPEESTGTTRWRWAQGSADMTLVNPSPKPTEVVLRGSVHVGNATAMIHVRIGEKETRLRAMNGLAVLAIPTTLKPGINPVEISTDSSATQSAGDVRDLRQQLIDFDIVNR